MKLFSSIIIFCFLQTTIFGQSKISSSPDSLTKFQKKNNLKFHLTELIVPVTLMSYGIIGLQNTGLKDVNQGIEEEVTEHIDERITIDDFMQYAPAATVYGLNAFGVKGKNNLKDRSIVLGTSYLIMSATVITLKKTTKVERPDGRDNNSFPSGHTATAFASAEFLWHEYKDVSIWYGVSGYLVAAGTGAFRIYNNRHWLTDVAMGAGIGMLSTKIAYWIYPVIEKSLFSKSNKTRAMLAPFYNGKQAGLGVFAKLN